MKNQEENANRLFDKICQSPRQFKEKDDMSRNVNRPEKTFAYAFDEKIVDDAMNEFDANRPTEYVEGGDVYANYETLLAEAKHLTDTHPITEVRDLGRGSSNYLSTNPYFYFSEPRANHDTAASFLKFQQSMNKAKTSYKKNNDVSGSIFGPPSSDIVFGYDIPQTLQALEDLKEDGPQEYTPGTHTLTRPQALIFEAENVAKKITDPEVLDFTRRLTNYLHCHIPDSALLRVNPLTHLTSVLDVQPEQDILEPVEDDISELNGIEK